MSKWTANDIPDLTGKLFIITGANSGLGYESTRALARKNATVIMGCRSLERGTAARAKILQEIPNAHLDVQKLDLGDQTQIREFATQFKEKHDSLNVLMNNAGVMATPQRRQTKDGYEMQLGINHFGHFTLTGLLLEPLLATSGSRIVNVSSGLHQRGNINFDDVQLEHSYSPWQAYGNSKLANLLFTYELQRKLSAANSSTLSVGAHPGYAATNLQQGGSDGNQTFIMRALMGIANALFAQSAEMGALSQLYAAVSTNINGCDYIGPKGSMRGYPTKERSNAASYNEADAARLWQISEEVTGVTYNVEEIVG